MIPIDKDIPIPNRKCMYPFNEMEVGDSFFTKKSRKTMSSIARYWTQKLKANFFTAEVVERGVEGTRVWRTK